MFDLILCCAISAIYGAVAVVAEKEKIYSVAIFATMITLVAGNLAFFSTFVYLKSQGF